jgi:hypothetical protein
MIDYILREIRWYHVLGLILGLVVIMVLVLWITRRNSQPRRLPGSDNGDII